MHHIVSGHQLFLPNHPLHLDFVDITQNDNGHFEISKSQQSNPGKWVSNGFCEPFAQFGDTANLHKESFDSFEKVARNAGYSVVALSPEAKTSRESEEQVQHILSKSSQHLSLLPYAALTKHLENQAPSEMYELKVAGAVGFSNGNQPINDHGLMVRLLQYTSMLSKPLMYTPQLTNIAGGKEIHDGEVSMLTGWEGNPFISETIAIQRDIQILEYYGGSIIWNKITSAHSIPLIKAAKEKGLNVKATVSIHNLVYTDQKHIGLDPYWKLFPTLRSEEDRMALINAVLDGTIDGIVSDHQPQDFESKEVEFEYAEYGISSQEYVFPLLINALGKHNIEPILNILSSKNYHLVNIQAPTQLQSICKIDLEANTEIKSFSKGINNPYKSGQFTAKAEIIA